MLFGRNKKSVGFSAREMIDIFVDYHNGSATELRRALKQHEDFKTLNPDFVDCPEVMYKGGRLEGSRDELIGIRAVIERAQAELENASPFEGITLEPLPDVLVDVPDNIDKK
jgi:hypothetical protein